jgi:hypothetical protein
MCCPVIPVLNGNLPSAEECSGLGPSLYLKANVTSSEEYRLRVFVEEGTE